MISIIVPAYNSAYTIQRCLDSIINQTFKDIEVIVINDGSTDNTNEILSQYYKYNFVHIHNPVPNTGVGNARNIGLTHLNYNSEYICFVDADDELIPTALEDLYQPNYDLICGDFNLYKENKIVYHNSLFRESTVCNKIKFRSLVCDFLITPKGNNNLCGPPWSKLYKTSIIKKYQLKFNDKLSKWEDTQFNLSFFPFVNNFLYTSKIVYNYYKDDRVYGNSISNYMVLFNAAESYLNTINHPNVNGILLSFIKYFLNRHLHEEKI